MAYDKPLAKPAENGADGRVNLILESDIAGEERDIAVGGELSRHVPAARGINVNQGDPRPLR